MTFLSIRRGARQGAVWRVECCPQPFELHSLANEERSRRFVFEYSMQLAASLNSSSPRLTDRNCSKGLNRMWEYQDEHKYNIFAALIADGPLSSSFSLFLSADMWISYGTYSQYIVHVYRKWLRYSASQIDEAPSSWRLVNAQPLPSSANLRPFFVPFCLPVVPSKTLAVFSWLVIVNEFSTISFWDLCKFSDVTMSDSSRCRKYLSNPDEDILQCRCEQRRQDTRGFTTLRDDKKSSHRLCQLGIFLFGRAFLAIRRHAVRRGVALSLSALSMSLCCFARGEYKSSTPPRYLLRNA